MVVIGIAGGIASGKSTVARMFQQLGAEVLDADRIGHEVLQLPHVIERIREQWGDKVFLPDGTVDRSALARIVFNPVTGARELERLEAITHPEITQRLVRQLDAMRAQSVPAVVLDAPVMFKAGWDRLCDRIVWVEADRDTRLRRAAERGWDAGELDRREALQAPIEWKRARATDVIDNSADENSTFSQVQRLWQGWRLPLPESSPTNQPEN